jgi:hypothetical protein
MNNSPAVREAVQNQRTTAKPAGRRRICWQIPQFKGQDSNIAMELQLFASGGDLLRASSSPVRIEPLVKRGADRIYSCVPRRRSNRLEYGRVPAERACRRVCIERLDAADKTIRRRADRRLISDPVRGLRRAGEAHRKRRAGQQGHPHLIPH